MKRKLFSKKDGTTFIQDVQGISQDVKDWFNSLPLKLKEWLTEAETIVDFIERIDQALLDGQPADEVIDFVLAQIPGSADEEIYEFAKEWLHEFVIDLRDYIEEANEISDYEGGILKFVTASQILQGYAEISQLEADTITQNAVYFYKS